MALMVDGVLLTETRERVLAWFAEAGRDLPWRATRDPYRVLVAEVLAQQTQAARAAGPWPRTAPPGRWRNVGAGRTPSRSWPPCPASAPTRPGRWPASPSSTGSPPSTPTWPG